MRDSLSKMLKSLQIALGKIEIYLSEKSKNERIIILFISLLAIVGLFYNEIFNYNFPQKDQIKELKVKSKNLQKAKSALDLRLENLSIAHLESNIKELQSLNLKANNLYSAKFAKLKIESRPIKITGNFKEIATTITRFLYNPFTQIQSIKIAEGGEISAFITFHNIEN